MLSDLLCCFTLHYIEMYPKCVIEQNHINRLSCAFVVGQIVLDDSF